MPQQLRSQTPYNSRNRETRAFTSRTRRTQKPPKLKPFQRVCWSNITKKRGIRSSYVTSNKNPSKKRPKLLHGNSKKRLRKSPKRKNGKNTNKPWGTTLNHLYIPWKVHTRSSFRPIILSSHKIAPWSSQASPIEILRKIGSENRKTKWARVLRDDCCPLSSKYIWRQPKD
jgi:hypothetical protein